MKHHASGPTNHTPELRPKESRAVPYEYRVSRHLDEDRAIDPGLQSRLLNDRDLERAPRCRDRADKSPVWLCGKRAYCSSEED